MLSSVPNILFQQAQKNSYVIAKRTFLNYVFNRVSEKRRKEVGPDRACSEWLMRNGAYIRWLGQSEFVSHYNALPLDKKIQGTFYIEEVKAESTSSIMYYGFSNFDGCKHINKVTFDGVKTIDDRALKRLNYLKHSLKYLHILNCQKVTSESLNYLVQLQNLKVIHLKNLNIKDYKVLEDKLPPDCKITIE